MEYDTLSEYAMDRISLLVDQLAMADNRGDDVTRSLLHQEIQDLTHSLDNDDEILAMAYHRTLSDSQGVVFEIDHGDPELMFGGM